MTTARQSLEINDPEDTFLMCPKCDNPFNQTDRRPRLLHSCLHAICTQCLHQLLPNGDDGEIHCPLCNPAQQRTGAAVALAIDWVRDKIIGFVEMRLHKRASCTECSEGNDAESRCHECRLYLCKDCSYVHKRHRVTRNHPLMSMDQVLQQPLKSLPKDHFCTRHPKDTLDFYCVTDGSICCGTCITEEHQLHNIERVQEAAKPLYHKLESSLQIVKSDIATLKDTRLTEDSRKIATQKEAGHVITEVEQQFTNLEKKVRDRKKAILNYIHKRTSSFLSICDKRITALDNSLDVMEYNEKYLSHVQENSDATEILQVVLSLKTRLGRSDVSAATHKTQPEDFLLKFDPAFVSTIEKIIPETGHITDAANIGNTNQERISFINEMFALTMKCSNKKELLAKLVEDLKGICSRCNASTDEPVRIRCRHCLCPRCFNTLFKGKEICPVCHKNCKVKTGNMPLGDMTTETLQWSVIIRPHKRHSVEQTSQHIYQITEKEGRF